MPLSKPRIIYVHFNKPGSKAGFPWTVHVAGRCIKATSVTMTTATETVWKPTKKENPRAFIRTRGFVQENADGSVVIQKDLNQ